MNFLVEGRYYRVDFAHGDIYTNCDIIDGDTGDCIATGEAVRHPNDNPNKAFGRKLSFTRAIVGFDRAIRREFWMNYFAYCQIPTPHGNRFVENDELIEYWQKNSERWGSSQPESEIEQDVGVSY
jgi:hypothetical protein